MPIISIILTPSMLYAPVSSISSIWLCIPVEVRCGFRSRLARTVVL